MPIIAYLIQNTLPHRRYVALLEFLLPYFGVWTLFSFIATVADAGVHWLWRPERIGWGAHDSHFPFVAALALACIWQITPWKRSFLLNCHRGQVLPPYKWQADVACFRFGLRYGMNCLGSCWALMLVMFGAGLGNLIWMPLLTILIRVEKMQVFPWNLLRLTAAAFAALAAASFFV
jgi:predicted metal-binding membrane protein